MVDKPMFRRVARRYAKHIADSLAIRVARRLPRSMRKTIAAELAKTEEPWPILARIAPRCRLVSVSVSGSYGVMRGTPSDTTILGLYGRSGTWSHGTNTRVASTLADGGTYIDVGANIGMTTIPIAQNPLVRCLALEPEPANFGHLADNVARNCPHRNVDVRQVAAFDRRARLRFELSPWNSGDHRVRLRDADGQFAEESRQTIEVDAEPLDEIAIAIEHPLAVKIDTQGAEPYVVAGGHRTLAQADLLVIEWAPYFLSRLGGDVPAMLSFLADHFSSIAFYRPGKGEHPTDSPSAACAELYEMLGRGKDAPTEGCDIIARKRPAPATEADIQIQHSAAIKLR